MYLYHAVNHSVAAIGAGIIVNKGKRMRRLTPKQRYDLLPVITLSKAYMDLESHIYKPQMRNKILMHNLKFQK